MNFNNLIDQERLARTFIQLCETDSPSKEEGRMAKLVAELLCAAGADAPFEDASTAQTGADYSNLIFRFAEDSELEPGRGIKARWWQGNRFTNSGETILGSDDKSGIASLTVLSRSLGIAPAAADCVSCFMDHLTIFNAENHQPNPCWRASQRRRFSPARSKGRPLSARLSCRRSAEAAPLGAQSHLRH